MNGAVIGSGGNSSYGQTSRASVPQDQPGLQVALSAAIQRLYHISSRLEQINDRFDPRPRGIDATKEPANAQPSYSLQMDRIDSVLNMIGSELDALERRA